MEPKHTSIEQTIGRTNDETGAPEQNPFMDMIGEIVKMQKDGAFPKGFDLEKACRDSAFAELVMEMPVQAAIRVYMAEQRASGAEDSVRSEMTQKLMQQKALPRAMQGSLAATPKADYRTMSSREFADLERRLREDAMNGIHRTI